MRHSLHWRLIPGLAFCAALVVATAPITGALTAGPTAAPAAQQPDPARLLLEEATKKEVVDGDLKGAIDAYQKILTLQGAPRAATAKALLGLGQCHEKLGNAEARSAYERLVRDFADQPEEMTMARARLAALGGRANGMRVRQVWAGLAPEGLFGSVTRDGRYLPLMDGATSELMLRDLATGQKRRLTTRKPGSFEFALASIPSPDGKLVAYTWYNAANQYELRTVGLDGSEARVLHADPDLKFVLPFDWTPDGKAVVALVTRKDDSSHLTLLPVPEGAARILKSFPRESPSRARFSPDGRLLAYDFLQQSGSPARDIGVMAAEGGPETVVVQHPANDVLFEWTPDGKSLLFGSDRSGAMSAWRLRAENGTPAGAPELVRADLGQDVRPLGFTRDGGFFYNVRTGLSEVYIGELDVPSGRMAAPPAPATDRYAGSNSTPDWSADGRELVFLSQRGPGPWGKRAICVKNSASGEVREIFSKLDMVMTVRWYPDGKAFLVGAQDPAGKMGPFRIDIQTGAYEPVPLDRPMPIGVRAAWSPDARTFYYQQWASRASGSFVVARDVASGRETVLHEVAVPLIYSSSLVLSPDGQQLAFVVFDSASGSKTLKVMPAAGGGTRDVLRDAQLPLPAAIAWAATSQDLLVVRQPNAKAASELWLVPARGGEPRKLEFAASNVRQIALHPDGRRLAFTSGWDRSEVWVMENFLPPGR